jgi:hypothetical protein
MHHIRLDVFGFSEFCESIRKGEGIVLCGLDLKGAATRIEIPAAVVSQMMLRSESGRLPVAAPALKEKTA